MIINCRNEQITLMPERAIYWPRKKMMIISDLHTGKAAHFRKSGIPVPATIATDDLERLSYLIENIIPEVLLITGDLIHFELNTEVALFQEWRKKYPSLKLKLIKGNHDLLKPADYMAMDIEVCETEYLCPPFRFIHEPPKHPDEYYNISGHIHPGVTLYGRSRQRIHLPCFYFGDHTAILPAFSKFTGLSRIPAVNGGTYYAIASDRVLQV